MRDLRRGGEAVGERRIAFLLEEIQRPERGLDGQRILRIAALVEA